MKNIRVTRYWQNIALTICFLFSFHRQEDKPQSNHTPELFKDDPGLQEAGGKAASDKTQPRDQGWAEAGW